MSQPLPPAQSGTGSGGFLSPPPESQPVDHCVRCGVETPAGEALCEEHNPRRLRGPSATQMHATVFGGIVLGVVGFFILATMASARTGPYTAEVTTSAMDADGSVALVFAVANGGDAEGVADCRITRDGVSRPDDLAFRTGKIPGRATVVFERSAPAPPSNSAGYVEDLVTVICN